MKKLESGITVD